MHLFKNTFDLWKHRLMYQTNTPQQRSMGHTHIVDQHTGVKPRNALDCYWPCGSGSHFGRMLHVFVFTVSLDNITCIDPAVQSAMRTSGKARRLYSYLLGCNSQLYNLLPQPGSKQTWTPGLHGWGGGGAGTQLEGGRVDNLKTWRSLFVAYLITFPRDYNI